jgi:hypothetical protein
MTIGAIFTNETHAAEMRNVSVDVEGDRDLAGRGQEPGGGEADRGRAERADREERVRRGELLLRRDVRQHALLGRVEELLHAARQDHDHVEQQDVDLDQERDAEDERRPDQVRRDHDLLATEAVDEDAGEEPDEETRDRGRHEHQTDGQRGPGLLEDQDARGEVGQRRADRRDELREPEVAEVTVAEDREHRRGGSVR